MAPKRRTTRLNPGAIPTPVTDTHTTTSVTNAQIQAMIKTKALLLAWLARHAKSNFVTCTLQGNALTWWNSHVKTTTPEAAHACPWEDLVKKMKTDKYCPRVVK
ncbi:hypothetical protein Tco_1371554 [Tanacetum coccineum]